MLQAEGGFGARVLVVLCGLPTSNYVRVRAPPLFTASTTIHRTPRQKGCDLVFCERI